MRNLLQSSAKDVIKSIVDTLKNAKKEGRLIETAREIFAVKDDDSSDVIDINNIKIKRVVWCYLGND